MAVLFPGDYIYFLWAALPPPVSRDNEFNTREKFSSSCQRDSQGFGFVLGHKELKKNEGRTFPGTAKVFEHFLPGITFLALFPQEFFAPLHLCVVF